MNKMSPRYLRHTYLCELATVPQHAPVVVVVATGKTGGWTWQKEGSMKTIGGRTRYDGWQGRACSQARLHTQLAISAIHSNLERHSRPGKSDAGADGAEPY